MSSKGEANVVAAEAFDITEPTVNSQVVNLAFSKADVLFIAATSRQTIQALKKAADLGWHPLIIVTSLASSVDRTYALAGLEISKGAVSATVFKDPADPDTAQDPDVRTYRAWMERYYPAGDWKDALMSRPSLRAKSHRSPETLRQRCQSGKLSEASHEPEGFQNSDDTERHRHRHRQRQLRHLSLVSTHSIRWGRQSNGRRPKRRLTAAIARIHGPDNSS